MTSPKQDSDVQLTEEVGLVRISDDVVSVIAGIAASEVEGVYEMSGGIVGDLTGILGKKNPSKGVKVEVGENEASVDIFVVLKFGVRIPEVCRKIQENVKRTIEIMTGLRVSSVNVHVQGVSFDTANSGEAVPAKHE